MASAVLLLPLGITMPLHAQTQWQPIDAGTEETTQPTPWETVPTEGPIKKDLVWEPLSPEEERLEPEQWEPTTNQVPLKINQAELSLDKKVNKKRLTTNSRTDFCLNVRR